MIFDQESIHVQILFMITAPGSHKEDSASGSVSADRRMQQAQKLELPAHTPKTEELHDSIQQRYICPEGQREQPILICPRLFCVPENPSVPDTQGLLLFTLPVDVLIEF